MNIFSKLAVFVFLTATLLLQGCATQESQVRSYETGEYLRPGPIPFTLVHPNGRVEFDRARCGRAEGSARGKGSVLGAIGGLTLGLAVGDKLGGTAERIAPTVGVIVGGAAGGAYTAAQAAKLCEQAYFYAKEQEKRMAAAAAAQPPGQAPASAPVQYAPAMHQQTQVVQAPVPQQPTQLTFREAAQECANRSAGKKCPPGQAWSVMNITGNTVSCACRSVTGQ